MCKFVVELEEPFSSSEEELDEAAAATQKRRLHPALSLPLPRRRIRTLSGMVAPTGFSPVWGGPTKCLQCLEFFDLPKETPKFVEHLLEKHEIVINDIDSIVDLKRYVEHWHHKFSQTPVGEIFPKIQPRDDDPLKGS